MSQETYELQDPFEYAHKGDVIKATFIEIVAPGFDQMQDFVIIKQALLAAVTEIQEQPDAEADKAEEKVEDDSNPLTGATIMQLLYMGKGELPPVMKAAKRLLTDGVASVEGVEKLTVPLLKKMSMRDFEGLVGAYLANFILPSLAAGT